MESKAHEMWFGHDIRYALNGLEQDKPKEAKHGIDRAIRHAERLSTKYPKLGAVIDRLKDIRAELPSKPPISREVLSDMTHKLTNNKTGILYIAARVLVAKSRGNCSLK